MKLKTEHAHHISVCSFQANWLWHNHSEVMFSTGNYKAALLVRYSNITALLLLKNINTYILCYSIYTQLQHGALHPTLIYLSVDIEFDGFFAILWFPQQREQDPIMILEFLTHCVCFLWLRHQRFKDPEKPVTTNWPYLPCVTCHFTLQSFRPNMYSHYSVVSSSDEMQILTHFLSIKLKAWTVEILLVEIL